MRAYYMNVVDTISKTPIELFEKDTEFTCREILLSKDNYNPQNDTYKSTILFKQVILLYAKLIKHFGKDGINEKVFYFNEDRMDVSNEYIIHMLNSFSELIYVYRMDNELEKISYAYDNMCQFFLDEVRTINYCCFKDDKCASIRYPGHLFPDSDINGCCHNTYKDRGRDCRYMNEDHSCSICSISCRAFTCEYLQERGIDHSLWQYPLMDCLFKKLYRSRIIYGFFIPKEVMMKRLKRGTYTKGFVQ